MTTPFRIFFGNNDEAHKSLLNHIKEISIEDPELFEDEKDFFAEQGLVACGSHQEAHDLAVIDAGLMVVEGLEVPELVSFTERSGEYGMGDRVRTQMIAERALQGTWKLHLSEK